MNIEDSIPVCDVLVHILTNREQEVLALIAEGLSTKAIAGRLGISFKTVACYRSRLMDKLGAPNTVALVRQAIRVGLIHA
jgi:DNA-binding NarL/FixJ family response regulator